MAGTGRMSTAGVTAGSLRAFLRTESGSAGVLVAAIAVALVWANLLPAAYEGFWTLSVPVRIGPLAVELDLREWVNSGLMTLFFLVVGLEARREIDLGDLRERRRLILPVAAGVAGMAVPVLLYLAINGGGPGAHGWGAAMSTDTALALGVLTVVGRGVPDRIRTFVLTVFVVDDIVALVVIALAYSTRIDPAAFAVAAVAYLGVLASRRLDERHRTPVLALLTLTVWGALLAAGIDPVVAGLAVGLATSAYLPRRGALEAATTLVRLFREQPTPELARTATTGLTATLSANARLQHGLHRATRYLVVPLFALANAGIAIDVPLLAGALTAPITIGIVVAYVIGKPVAVFGTSWLVTRMSRGTVRPPVGWAAVLGSGTVAGVGFTVSLLIADLAFTGTELDEAKLGVLLAAAGAALLSLVVYRLTGALPAAARTRALLGTARQLTDLVPGVDTARDHVRGPADAAVTVVEYGDFECPWTGMIAPTARDLLAGNSDIRYVWRHLPLPDVHPHAQLAAEAAEAAGAQGAFWPMHDLLLADQGHLHIESLVDHAHRLGLDVERFRDDLLGRRFAARVIQDVESADLSGVSGTPTFVVNGHRHDGPQDLATLNAVIGTARDHVAALHSAVRPVLVAAGAH
ncbi:Na+/H+ antiporter NhaA [Pseudonocardia sp. GCM10023141]|uniref:Na+/H+ antiporter NhaA n=1 Tax=Pseudonocardia sp. GCM10023141 TaxID=3252653 RepID=UPI0036107F76